MLRIHFFFFFVLLLFVVGCSDKVSLKGKVTFTDDGSPLTKGTVAFVQGGKLSRGDIKEDGTYVVGTDKLTDGLPPGTYQVYISGAMISELVEFGDVPGVYNHTPLIHSKYDSPETSGLSVEVNSSTKTYDIKVDRF
jgi:hypothetical protein